MSDAENVTRRAFAIIDEGAQDRAQIPSFRDAFCFAWAKLETRVGDAGVVATGLARLIVRVGNRRPELTPIELADLVEKTFHKPSDQEDN